MPSGETLQIPLDRPTAKAPFRLALPWDLAGDQPHASAGLLDALTAGERHVTLRGVTGSGKTVTMAKVIAEAGRPALVLAHNKTLAAQLYGSLRSSSPQTPASNSSPITATNHPGRPPPGALSTSRRTAPRT